ncbi:6-phosphogluconate dehydrogenase family protein [Talaromyces pinophilus]|uniref:6-phosphogluconate dehydrogenase family protein n=2 Tax=Talaromyces pinophilus TaxID=128442 RepID=A0A6V8H8E7_TALPI|nr:6-phosphogluconate dehydrogenase family protein [Talaromyces pinophilus]
MTISRKYLFGGEAPWSKQDWTTCDDRVRGGSSTSQISIRASTVDHPSKPTYSSSAFFQGHLDINSLGGAGFASQRNTTNTLNWHLEGYDGLEFVVGKSDGKRYSFVLKDEMLPKRPDGREQSSLNWEYEFAVPLPKEGEEGVREGTVFRVKCFFGMQQGDFEIEIKSIAAFKEGDEQVESPAPVRQDGEDMTEKLRQQQQEEQRGGRPPPSRERIEDAMGMTKNLVQKGSLSSPLLLYNRTYAKAESHAHTLGGTSKAKPVHTIREAVSPSDIIFTCVGDDAAVEDIFNTALAEKEDVKGKLFVDMSTIHPDTSRKLYTRIVGKGGRFVSCPVFGVPAMAEAGQLICVLGGSKTDVQRILPYTIGVMARANIDLSFAEGEGEGEQGDVGKASTMKLIGNSFILSFVEQLAEGLTLAEKSGVGIDPLAQWMELMFPGPLPKYVERMQSGDYYKREYPLFQVDLARKDLRHVSSVAEASGMRMRSLEVVDKYLQDVKAHSGERGDIAGMYGAVRKESGLKFENDE